MLFSLKPWQWAVLAIPPAAIVVFLLAAAGVQIHAWGLNWLWAIATLALVGCRWLLGYWTRPVVAAVEAAVDAIEGDGPGQPRDWETRPAAADAATEALAVRDRVVAEARQDAPLWDDWEVFWGRCQSLVEGVARAYHPEVKYPLLEIYVPQAYGLIRGTVDDLDRAIAQLSPVLGRVTVGQAYRSYEVYQRLEPAARKLWQVWGWGQWLLNPAAAAANALSRPTGDRANQQFVANLSQLLREAALNNLCQRSIALYGGTNLPAETFEMAAPAPPKTDTQTLRSLLERARTPAQVTEPPVNVLLLGRTGAGKSSFVNGFFDATLAETDVLPSTDTVRAYRWTAKTGEALTVWDTPGYEQIARSDYRDRVLAAAEMADLVILATPAADPALSIDAALLDEVRDANPECRAISIVTQVDRLRPLREWQPPYDWRSGDRPKERNIRDAVTYRLEALGDRLEVLLPVVLPDADGRSDWGLNEVAAALLDRLEPAKQLRLGRFLRTLDRRAIAAARIIDKYVFQMSTTQGLTALLKSPVLQFLSVLTTGQPTLAYLLAERIPVEQLPVVVGKLQLAYELFSFLSDDRDRAVDPGSMANGDEADDAGPLPQFDLLSMWPMLLDNRLPPERDAQIFGYALVEYWVTGASVDALQQQYRDRVDAAVAGREISGAG